MRMCHSKSESGESEDGLEPLRPSAHRPFRLAPATGSGFRGAEGFEVGSDANLSFALFGARVFWGVFSRVPVFGPAPFAIGCRAVGVLVEFAAE